MDFELATEPGTVTLSDRLKEDMSSRYIPSFCITDFSSSLIHHAALQSPYPSIGHAPYSPLTSALLNQGMRE